LADATQENADKIAPGLRDAIAGEIAYLSENWPAKLPGGVIHADLFPDNVFFRHETLSGIIDFYFACNDFLVYDIAICLNAWCFEPDGSFNITKARNLVQGYADIRPFAPEEIAALPLLARGAALRFLLTRLYDWLNHPEGAFVKPKDPLEYLRKLRFHQRVASPAEYGLDG
jgi:homoserine kinase type II